MAKPDPAPRQRRAYAPHEPLRRPGGRPSIAPTYRVLINRGQVAAWHEMSTAAGVGSVSQCWDHLAQNPGQKPPINSGNPLAGKKFGPTPDGFSRVMHYRVSSAWRVDYRFHDRYDRGLRGDSHRIVVILYVGRSKSGT